MKILTKTRLVLGVILISAQVFAGNHLWNTHLAIGLGKSHDRINIYRLGIRNDFSNKTFPSHQKGLNGYYEISLNRWNIGEENIYGAAISPIFRYQISIFSNQIQPYIEAGIGVAYISNTRIGHRNMTTHFQFEDRIGVGFRSEYVGVNFGYMHYSNASIKPPNDGIDIFILTSMVNF